MFFHRTIALTAICLLNLITFAHSADSVPPVTGIEQPGLAALDRIMLELLSRHEIPGASLAVSKNGRLVYARGFGYADVEQQQPVEPNSRFRIASISKPLTAVAIVQLVEQGKLKLDDKVLEILELAPRRVEGAKGDARLLEVTVRQCLQHTGGWDRDKSFDPMFRSVAFAKELNIPAPAGPHDVIQCMLGVPLDFAPGERFAYSNFGYCVLGRVIEKVTGKSYEEYVRTVVLAPLGIREMQIGKTLLAGRAAGEVKYYDQAKGPAVLGEQLGEPVPQPYGAWYLEAMDSHGAWIASAADLVRFAAAFDEPDHCQILKAESIAALFVRPAGLPGYDAEGQPKPVYYGLGWNVRPVAGSTMNTWHTGSLPGTSTLLIRRHDGIDWSVLFNRRDGKDAKRMSAHADDQINQAISSIESWPTIDLYSSQK